MDKYESKKTLENKKQDFAVFNISITHDGVNISYICMIKNSNSLLDKSQVTRFRKLLDRYNFEFDREKSIAYVDANLKKSFDFIDLYDGGDASYCYGTDLDDLCKNIEPRMIETIQSLPEIVKQAKESLLQGGNPVQELTDAISQNLAGGGNTLGQDSEGFSQIVKFGPLEPDDRCYQ